MQGEIRIGTTMTSSTITAVNHNEPMDPPHPRADGPRRRRAFTASDKIAHLHAYEQACEHGDGGAYLWRGGPYFSFRSGRGKQPASRGLAGETPPGRGGGAPAQQSADPRRPPAHARRTN